MSIGKFNLAKPGWVVALKELHFKCGLPSDRSLQLTGRCLKTALAVAAGCLRLCPLSRAAAAECSHQGCSSHGLHKLNTDGRSDGSVQHRGGGTFCGEQSITNVLATILFLWSQTLFVVVAWASHQMRSKSLLGASVTLSRVQRPDRALQGPAAGVFVLPRHTSVNRSRHFKLMDTRQPVTCSYLSCSRCLHFDTSYYSL